MTRSLFRKNIKNCFFVVLWKTQSPGVFQWENRSYTQKHTQRVRFFIGEFRTCQIRKYYFYNKTVLTSIVSASSFFEYENRYTTCCSHYGFFHNTMRIYNKRDFCQRDKRIRRSNIISCNTFYKVYYFPYRCGVPSFSMYKLDLCRS